MFAQHRLLQRGLPALFLREEADKSKNAGVKSRSNCCGYERIRPRKDRIGKRRLVTKLNQRLSRVGKPRSPRLGKQPHLTFSNQLFIALHLPLIGKARQHVQLLLPVVNLVHREQLLRRPSVFAEKKRQLV